jgi:hypothetical protein
LAAATAGSAGLLSPSAMARDARAAELVVDARTIPTPPETLVASFYKTLTDEQRNAICFPFDHPLRSKVDNNWLIVDQPIGNFLTADQQAMVKEIFLDIHSEEYARKVLQQVEHDNIEDGGFKACAVAMFGEPGEPGKSKFEFVFTGRHVTRRCDGNSVAGAAFGGPIFYGHAAEGFRETARHPGNIYWYQAERANHLFQALDGKQRNVALRDDPRREQGSATVSLSGKTRELTGLPVSELAGDQKQLMRQVMHDLLAPFRKADADEAMKLIDDAGYDNLHLTFYKNMDIGNDGVWDLWQVEGPAMLWYFRGAPHVHTWVHVREPSVKI